MSQNCVGTTGSVPRLGLEAGFCLQDGPAGVRDTDYISSFPAGGTIAASFDRALMRQRGAAMGAEHKGKGVTVQLGPAAGPIGRAPEGGRNWEGFSPDPVLSGVGMAETIKGIQSQNVLACAKVSGHTLEARLNDEGGLLTQHSTSLPTSKSTSAKVQKESATASTSASLSPPTSTTALCTSYTHGHLPTQSVPVSDPSCALTTRSTTPTAARTRSS